MTNTPEDGQTPENPSSDQPGQNEPGYWQQQPQQQGQPPYGQQPYGQPPGYPPQPPMQYAPDHPQATTALVLGILGLVLCQVIAPFAWSMGKKAVAEIDASQGRVGGRSAANAGYIMGVIGTILLGLAILFFVFFIGIAILGAATTATSY